MNHSTAQGRAARHHDGTTGTGRDEQEPGPDGPSRPHRALHLRRGLDTDEDLKRIVYLIDETARWLSGKGTDQWRTPWPDRRSRDGRVRDGLRAGRTWMVWDRTWMRLAATVTVQTEPDLRLWPGAELDRAVFPCRLVVDRDYAGLGLGAELMDWVGYNARESYEAEFVRIDVWTTNKALHRYYERFGFQSRGLAPLAGYPAAALFEKPTKVIDAPAGTLFSTPLPNPFA
ncbi:GNAT family N-acetyltransferase [Spirillospora sp. CA-255316]